MWEEFLSASLVTLRRASSIFSRSVIWRLRKSNRHWLTHVVRVRYCVTANILGRFSRSLRDDWQLPIQTHGDQIINVVEGRHDRPRTMGRGAWVYFAPSARVCQLFSGFIFHLGARDAPNGGVANVD